MKKDSIDSQEEIRARLKEKMDNKRCKQSNSSRKSPKKKIMIVMTGQVYPLLLKYYVV